MAYRDPDCMADALSRLPPWGALLPSSAGTHHVHVRPVPTSYLTGYCDVRLKYQDLTKEDARILRDAFGVRRPPARRPPARPVLTRSRCPQVMLDEDDDGEGKPLWQFDLNEHRRLLPDPDRSRKNRQKIADTLNAAVRLEVCPTCRAQPCDPLQGACFACAAKGVGDVGVRAHDGTIAGMAAAVFKDRTPAELEATMPGAAACCVCHAARELTLAFNCGHVSCGACARRWDERACPVCRARVTDCTRLFAGPSPPARITPKRARREV